MQQAVKYYQDLGLAVIPLIPLSKKALVVGWQKKPSDEQWVSAPENANIGLRCGGISAFCVIDSDDKKKATWNTIQNFLWGLGLEPGSYPVISTPNQGRHAYFFLDGKLDGNYCLLNPEAGTGEFRFGEGAYVVAPPSLLSIGTYRLIDGDIEHIPIIVARDILPVLAKPYADKCNHEEKRRKPSRFALRLLHGYGVENYPSRSEAEQALLVSLINKGFSFEEALDLFNRYPCAGKYSELRKENTYNARRWLNHSYSEAKQWANRNESYGRRNAREAITWAESIPWPGKTGSVDRLVFIAHAQISYRVGQTSYTASSRELGELAGVSFRTASLASIRLCNKGLLVLETPAVAEYANIYRMNFDQNKLSHFPISPTVRKCESEYANHDVFRYGGLGKSAAEIWGMLSNCPSTINQLAENTGRHITTIKRCLDRMVNLVDTFTGEPIPMVATDDDFTFHALPVDLNRIAVVIGTAGIGEHQREMHIQERILHRNSLMMSRQFLKNNNKAGI